MKMNHHPDKHVRIGVIILTMLIVPLVASASWWNPISWFGGWFGLFNKYETVKTERATTTLIDEDDGRPSVVFPTQSGGSFSRATSTTNPDSDKPQPPPPPQKATTTPSAPRPSSSITPTQPRPTSPKPKPTPPPAKPVPKTLGVVTFYSDIAVARRTTGTATSSNVMRIWFPSTSTKMTVKQTAVSGISFKTAASCKAFPCELTNVASVSSSVKEGVYPVSVTVTSGTSTAIGTFSITILPPEQIEIQMSVSGPITVKKNVNGSVTGSNVINVQLLRGTPEKLTITRRGLLPEGVTGKEVLGTCTPPCKITNSLSVTNAADTGRFPLTVTATGNTVTRSVGFDLNVGYSSTFGMHFDAEKKTYTQNQNPTSEIVMDFPFDLLLDGGTPETATLIDDQSNASTSVTYSRSSCTLPCMGMNARIKMLKGMKPGSYTVKLQAVVERSETDSRGNPKIVTYKETWSIPVKIITLLLPY